MPSPRKLQSLKDARRQRLAALLDEHGKTRLGELVGISGDYLWQMGKGKGTSARGISDATAAKIERGTGNPPGWLDGESVNGVTYQTVGALDLEMVRDVAQALQDIFADDGRVYRIDRFPELFVEFYEARVRMEEINPTADAMLVGKWIERYEGEHQDGRVSSVPAARADKAKAGRNRTKG